MKLEKDETKIRLFDLVIAVDLSIYLEDSSLSEVRSI